jgi:hypothetical protein
LVIPRASGPQPRCATAVRFLRRGYLKDEQATADAWRDDWFHTGDLGGRTNPASSTSSTAART